MAELRHWEEDPALYVFTSLTAGSSHVVTATSRIETILRANRIPFSYIDTATNDSARQLFQRRGKGKKLPLLVKEGFVLADLDQVEEWNEFGELKDAVGTVATQPTSITTTPAKAPAPGSSSTPATAKSTSEAAATTTDTGASSALENTASSPAALALRQAAFETASAAKAKKGPGSLPKPLSSSANSVPTESATPATPSKVPLPPTPAGPLSPGSPLASPPATGRSSPRHRHSGSSGSVREGKPFVPEHYDPAPTSHRGSSVSLASEEEIREIECKETILEENEDEDGEGIVIPPVKHASKGVKESKDSDEDHVKVEAATGLEKPLEKAHLKDAEEKEE